MNKQYVSSDIDVLTSLMLEVLGKSKARIMKYLILNTEKSQRFVTIKEIKRDMKISREKTYQYLKELRDSKLALSSPQRPAKYRSIERVALVKRLSEIAEDRTTQKKRKLDKQLAVLKERLSNTKIRPTSSLSSRFTPRLYAIKERELDTILCESLRILGEKSDILYETPSILFLEEKTDEMHMERYESILKHKLSDRSITELKCISRIETDISCCISATIEENVRKYKDLTILFTDKVYRASPTTTIFGNLRVIISFACAIERQPYVGFMLEGLDAVRSFRNRFQRFFDEVRNESLTDYLDNLRIKQKAGVFDNEVILKDLIGSLVQDPTKKEWNRKSWSEQREILIRDMSEEQQRICLRNHSLDQLRLLQKRLSSN